MTGKARKNRGRGGNVCGKTAGRRKMRCMAAVVLLCCLFLAACGKEEGVRWVFTTSFEEDEIFRIGDADCRLGEIMVYLTTTQNQYESVYGPQIWETSVDGVTLEENVKEIVLARIAQVKTMYLLALEKEIGLTPQEESQVQAAAREYFQALNTTEKELLGVTQETVEQLYLEYTMADKVYREIIRDVNPEISDDEARTITVQHIFFRSASSDPEAARQAVYEKACQVQELAVAGEDDFTELASRYSEDTSITYSFGKGEMEEAYEKAAFQLATDEISRVVEGAKGYYIIKCVNTFNREETDANKLKIVEERKNEVFGQEYDRFVETLVRSLNEELWETVGLIHNEEVTTSDFFEIYEKYFS